MNHFRRVLGPLDVNTLSSETRWKRNQSDVADVRRGDNMAARSSWKKPFFSFFFMIDQFHRLPILPLLCRRISSSPSSSFSLRLRLQTEQFSILVRYYRVSHRVPAIGFHCLTMSGSLWRVREELESGWIFQLEGEGEEGRDCGGN